MVTVRVVGVTVRVRVRVRARVRVMVLGLGSKDSPHRFLVDVAEGLCLVPIWGRCVCVCV